MISKIYTIVCNGKTYEITISISSGDQGYYTDYQWDSKTGEVSAYDSRLLKRVLLSYTGTSTCEIGPGPITSTTNIRSLEYDYWYY